MEKEELYAILFEFNERVKETRKMINEFDESKLNRLERSSLKILELEMSLFENRFDNFNEDWNS